jgi:MFS family permease
MVAGAIAVLVSGVIAATAVNFWIVVLSQLTWGMGTSIWMFGREIAAFDMVRPDQRGRQMSALMGIGSTGMALGPAFGGFLTDSIGIRPLFWVYAGTAAIVLLISVIQPGTHIQRERKAAKFFDLKAIKQIHPFYRMTYLVLFFSTFGQMARSQVVNSALPLYTQEELSMTATQTGFLFSLMAIITFVMIVPTGFISDKLGRKWAAAPAAVASFVGFVLFPFFDDFATLAFAVFVVGIANGLAMGAMTIYTFDIVPTAYRGQLQAMRRSIGELGAVLSPPLVGLLASVSGPSLSFWVVAPLHGVSALLLIFVARESLRHRLPPGAPTSEEISRPAAGP